MTPRVEAREAVIGAHSDIDTRVLQAARALRAGEVVAIPTDTVYGLAAAIDRPDAIDRLYAIKGRPAEKAIPILLSDPKQLRQVSTGLSNTAAHLARFFWPGALTLVVPALSHLPSRLTSVSSDGLKTVAVRVPDDQLTRAIIAAAGGALAVTSANRSGEKPALAAPDIAALGAGIPIFVIDGGRAAGGVPSSVVLATGFAPVMLREGAISAAEISAVMAESSAGPGQQSSTRYDQSVIEQRQHHGLTETAQ